VVLDKDIVELVNTETGLKRELIVEADLETEEMVAEKVE
jgi:hypothetical protein